MRKILIIFTAIIFTFAFFYSCTIPIDDPDDGSIEKPGNEIPDPPENLQADIVTNDTIVISWDPVSNATAYKVIY
jgi:hypothetical protein